MSMLNHRRYLRLAGLVVLAMSLAACMASQGALTVEQAAGTLPRFWNGLWHGFVAPIAFIVSLFSEHVRIYAAPNAGRWYDFGFMLGISGFSGGIFAGSRTRSASAGAKAHGEGS